MVMAVTDTTSGAEIKTGIRAPFEAVQDDRLALPVKLYLAAVMLPAGFYAASIYMTPLRLMLLLLVVPLSIRLFRGDFGRVIITDVLFFLYIFWAALAWYLHHGGAVVQHIGSNGIEFLGGYLVARAYIRTRGQFIALCKVLGILIAITLPLTFYESQTNRPLLIDLARNLPGVRVPEVINNPPRLGMFRSQVVFPHPILYGTFCSLGFALTFIALKGQISDKRRYLITALVGASTFMSLSSGAILAVVIQVGLLVWYLVFRKIEMRWFLLLALFALAYVVVDVLSERSPVRVFMSYAAFSAHNAFWRGMINEWGMMNIFGSVIHEIPPSPWIGIGGNDWVRPHWMVSSSVDNFWLATGLQYGVPGFLFLAVGYGVAIITIILRNFRGDTELERIRRAWVFTFLGVTFTLITVHVWTALYSFIFFMFGAGMWMYPIKREDAPPERGPARYTRFSAEGGDAALQTRRPAPAPQYTRNPQSTG
jgi:hypothetical protein